MNKNNTRKYNIKFLVSISSLIIISIWIAWIIKYKPYNRNTKQYHILNQTREIKNNWQNQIKYSQSQIKKLQQLFTQQINSQITNNPTTTKTLEISPELIDLMKNYLSSSTVTTTTSL